MFGSLHEALGTTSPDLSMVQVDEQLESVWPSALALLCVLLAGSYVLFKPFGKQTTAMEPRDGHVPVKPKGKQHKVKKKAATATATATATAATTAATTAAAADAAAAAEKMELSGSTTAGSKVEEALLTACTQGEINAWVREWSDAAETTIPKSLKKACKQLKISKGKLEEWLKIAGAQQQASKAAESTATGSATTTSGNDLPRAKNQRSGPSTSARPSTTAKPSAAAAEPSAAATSYDPREFQKSLQVRGEERALSSCNATTNAQPLYPFLRVARASRAARAAREGRAGRAASQRVAPKKAKPPSSARTAVPKAPRLPAAVVGR